MEESGVEGTIEGAGGVKNTTRRPTEPANLGQGDLQRMNHQPKSMQGLDLDPHTYVADVQLHLHVSPPTTEVGTYPDSVAYLFILFP